MWALIWHSLNWDFWVFFWIVGIIIAIILIRRKFSTWSEPDFGSNRKPLVKDDYESVTYNYIKTRLSEWININAREKDEDTILMVAVLEWQKSVVELLLKNWAKPNIKNNRWEYPLIEAIRGSKEIVKLLLKYWANPNVEDNWWTVLWTAIWKWDKEIVELLLKHWADVNIKDKHWMTALMEANKKWHKDIEKLLLKHWAKGPN